MISTQTSALSALLSDNSARIQESSCRVCWGALRLDQFWLPEKMLSIYGTSQYERLSQIQRIKLSHFELLHFIEFGIWLESLFINRLHQCVDPDDDSPSNTYSLHIIREEAAHSLMFIEFIEQSGYDRVSINKQKLKIYNQLWSLMSVKSSLFWIFVLAGEEIPLRMNRFMLKERLAINNTVADIVRIHTVDESRHVAYASAMLTDALNSSNFLSRRAIRLLLPRLIKDFTKAFYYPVQNIYVLAGLDQGIDWEKVAHTNKYRQKFVDTQLDNILRPLHSYGISVFRK